MILDENDFGKVCFAFFGTLILIVITAVAGFAVSSHLLQWLFFAILLCITLGFPIVAELKTTRSIPKVFALEFLVLVPLAFLGPLPLAVWGLLG
jgi:hypothetical protein